MLKSAKREMEKICLSDNLKANRFLIAMKPSKRIPAKSMREAVKKRGGECSSAIFPRENMLDQVAYMKTTTKIDMGRIIAVIHQ